MSRVTSRETRQGRPHVKLRGIVRAARKRLIKYPHIGIVAREQGVTRQHLYEVLEGNRCSPRLKAAYEQHLKQLQEAA
jgi:DNA-binding phage protein